MEYDFDMVLNGHKHKNHVSLDGAVIPLSERRRYNPICIVSGGTIAGRPAEADQASFKLITLMGPSRPRTSAVITEVPLLDQGDVADVIKSRSRIYQVQLSSRQPELHDLSELKDQFDEYLFGALCPELASRDDLKKYGQSSLPSSHPDIVGKASQYKLFCEAEVDGKQIFVEVFLAMERITFRHRARLFWMLSDVKAYASSRNGYAFRKGGDPGRHG